MLTGYKMFAYSIQGCNNQDIIASQVRDKSKNIECTRSSLSFRNLLYRSFTNIILGLLPAVCFFKTVWFPWAAQRYQRPEHANKTLNFRFKFRFLFFDISIHVSKQESLICAERSFRLCIHDLLLFWVSDKFQINPLF